MDYVDAEENQDLDLKSLQTFHWLVSEIKYYETRSNKCEREGDRIIRRYKDVRTVRDGLPAKYNSLWAITQLMVPALYGRRPKPDIERRYRDKDTLGRAVSTILERSISYFVDEKFDAMMKQAVIDLHGAPGSQNGEDHSGRSSNGIHWNTPANINRFPPSCSSCV